MSVAKTPPENPPETEGDNNTIPSFATIPHPRRTWMVIEHYLSERPEFTALVRCLSKGITETAAISEELCWTFEEVEIRKARLHEEVRKLEESLRKRTNINVRIRGSEPPPIVDDDFSVDVDFD